jgi:DNA-binding MarR family transcriptional regulator
MQTEMTQLRPGSNAPGMGRVLDFMRLLWAVDHGLQSISKRLEASVGVTGPQRLVIRIVGQFPGISAGDLANILHIHPSTLTGVLKRLVSRGQIARRSDPHDARRAQFALTAAGQRLNRMRAGTVEAAVLRALSRLDGEQVDAACGVLKVLADELGAGPDEEGAD